LAKTTPKISRLKAEIANLESEREKNLREGEMYAATTLLRKREAEEKRIVNLSHEILYREALRDHEFTFASNNLNRIYDLLGGSDPRVDRAGHSAPLPLGAYKPGSDHHSIHLPRRRGDRGVHPVRLHQVHRRADPHNHHRYGAGCEHGSDSPPGWEETGDVPPGMASHSTRFQLVPLGRSGISATT